MRPSPPRFEGFQPAQQDFEASRTGLITPFRKLDIDLSVAPALATSQYTIEGDFIFQDLDPVASNGNMTIEFNRQQDADNGPIYMVPGLALTGTFKGFRLNWAVQAGKKARLIYSTGSRINPASASIATIGSITAPVTVKGEPFVFGNVPVHTSDKYQPASFYQTSTALAVGTNDNPIAPGSNVNGMVLNRSQWFSGNITGLSEITEITKASAPASSIDGNVLACRTFVFSVAGNFQANILRDRSIIIVAGLGLWFRIGIQTETNALRSVHYTLL